MKCPITVSATVLVSLWLPGASAQVVAQGADTRTEDRQ